MAVLIPCFNEAGAIGRVVADFRDALPEAAIYVYDNNSQDGTAELAERAGAIVRRERNQGKGFVVRRMFADVDADVYLLVDGDATYDSASASRLVDQLIDEQLDMVSALRVADGRAAFRPGHRFGNWLLSSIVKSLFGDRIADLLSGYRAFSRRYVKSFPALSRGFEIETELTVHALELRLPMAEVATVYRDRASGTVSKLRTYRDGLRILQTIVNLVREEKPLAFFGLLCVLFAGLSIGLSIPIFETYARTGLVPRFPTAVLSTGLMILAFLSFTCGVILGSLARTRKQLKWLQYLSVPPWSAGDGLPPP